MSEHPYTAKVYNKTVTLLHTARRSHSGTISDIWSKMRIFWPPKKSLTSHATPLCSEQIWVGFFKWGTISLLMSFCCKVIGLQSWRSPFGFEATFFVSLCSKSLLSERSRFDFRPAQSLRTYSFEAPWSTRIRTNFLGRSDLFLSVKILKNEHGYAFRSHCAQLKYIYFIS